MFLVVVLLATLVDAAMTYAGKKRQASNEKPPIDSKGAANNAYSPTEPAMTDVTVVVVENGNDGGVHSNGVQKDNFPKQPPTSDERGVLVLLT